ncbi:hypothetical protein ABFX02_04G054400 [Erythranthe guttata]
MGRVRAKGKKLSVTNEDENGSSEEVKVLARKRRGRPQKSLKDEFDENEAQKIEDDNSEDLAIVKDAENKSGPQNGKRQKRNIQVAKEKLVDSVKDENEDLTKSSAEESKKSNGFRQSRNRRKSKPCRAAEAVVECN